MLGLDIQIQTCLYSNQKVISTIMINNLERKTYIKIVLYSFKYHWKTYRKTAESVSKQKYWFFLYFPHFFGPQIAKETLYTKLALMHNLDDLALPLVSVLIISKSIFQQSTTHSWQNSWKCGKKTFSPIWMLD